jgi:hypothetical protein
VGQALDWYLADTTSLLRDWSFQFTSQPRLIRWINAGRYQTAKRSGCLRVLVPGQAPYGANSNPGVSLPGNNIPFNAPSYPNAFTPGSGSPGVRPDSGFNAWLNTERYAFGYANPFLRAANEGFDSINDVFQVAVNWQSFRPAMSWMPWDDLQAYARAYSFLVSAYPLAWSTFGSGTSGQVWLWPPPSQTLEMEWDCTCLPKPLYTNNDYDAIPDSFANAVKWYAAGMAFLGSFRYGMAETMFQAFINHLGVDQASAEGGKVTDYYYTSLAMS